MFYAPRIKILITSVKGERYELLAEDLRGDFQKLHTSKAINDVAGSFSVTLIARDNLQVHYSQKGFKAINVKRLTAYELFRPMTLIDIYINNKEVLLGVIDECERGMTMGSNGQPSRSYELRGRDLGALLIDNKIWYDKDAEATKRGNYILTQGIQFMQNIKSTYVHKILQRVYDIWFRDVLNKKLRDPVTGKYYGGFEFADSEKIDDKVVCSTAEGQGLSINNYAQHFLSTFQAWNFEGNIFQFLKSFSAAPFNELFVQTGDTDIALHSGYRPKKSGNEKGIDPNYKPLDIRKCHVIFRPAPFDDSKVTSRTFGLDNLLEIHHLPEHDIDDKIIVDKKLKFSRQEVYSLYTVAPMSSLIGEDHHGYYVGPEYDIEALKRYGHNPLKVSLDCFVAKPGKTKGYPEMAKSYQKKLRKWFANNDKYLTGYFKIRGNEKIRIGQKLNYNKTKEGRIDEPIERGYYYISRVEHDYQFGGSFTTTVGVSRGTSYDMIPEMKRVLGEAVSVS